ncbi:MAG: hypothetical protein L6R41_005980 [Letrouitia leprolyta]|nr:MAG: hypothetical protein L6R41_005980 [Letrouitia leprolyta]
MADVGCQQSFDCACHNLKFLNVLKASIPNTCPEEDQDFAISVARDYCSSVNPGLRDTKTAPVLATVIVFAILAIASVTLRFWARKIAAAHFGWDDWFIAAGLLFALASDAVILAGVCWGIGRHTFMVDQVTLGLKSFIATHWMYIGCSILVRLSILALYIRLFSSIRTFFIVTHVTAWIVIVSELAFAFIYTFSCRPVAYFWDPTIRGGHCLDKIRIMAAFAGIDAMTGVWVLLLPIPIILQLQTDKKRKFGLIVLFALGAFVCVTAIIRMPFLLQLDPDDLDWSTGPLDIWSIVEFNMAIVSVCLPTMTPLFKRWMPWLLSPFRSTSGRQRAHLKQLNIIPDDESLVEFRRKVLKPETRIEGIESKV